MRILAHDKGHSMKNMKSHPREWAVVLLSTITAGILSIVVIALRNSAAEAKTETSKIFAPLAQSAVFTDTYEVNNTLATASNIAAFQPPSTNCSSPATASPLSIWQFSSPAFDIDYFRVIPSAQKIFTVTIRALAPVSPATSNDLVLRAQLKSSTDQQLGFVDMAAGSQTSLSYYNLNASTNYYVAVSALNAGSATQTELKPYQLELCESSTNITPTPTSTTGPTPTSTSTAGPVAPDAYENNNRPADVLAQNPIRSFLNVGSTLSSSALPNFFSTAPIGSIRENGDVDWFFIYAARSREHGGSAGRYRVTTSVQPGVDTEIGIFRDDQLPPDNISAQGLIAANDDYKDFDRGSQIEFSAPYDGRYWIKIWNKDPSPRTGSSGYNPSYNIAIVEIGASATTTVPTSTPFPQGIDRFEFNGDIERATLIAPNVKYDNLNFVPFQPPSTGTIDNDFFRMPVKQGVFYTCETLDLAGGADTNLIVYNQNATMSNRDTNFIGGNNDINQTEVQRGNFASRFSWLASYTGYVYILVGDVNPPRSSEAAGRTYSLQCTIGLPNTPTPTVDPRGTATPRPPVVPPTPEPPEPTMTPFPTPRSAQNLVVRPLDASQLRPTRAPQPTPRVITLDVQVFNDLNRNGLLDAGEGVANTSVRIADENGGAPLSQAYTDAEGRVRFSITNDAPVRVTIPLFGYSTVVNDANSAVRLALVPNIELPSRLP